MITQTATLTNEVPFSEIAIGQHFVTCVACEVRPLVRIPAAQQGAGMVNARFTDGRNGRTFIFPGNEVIPAPDAEMAAEMAKAVKLAAVLGAR